MKIKLGSTDKKVELKDLANNKPGEIVMVARIQV